MKQESPFCPDIAASPDGKQVWFTLKDTGKVMIFNARPPFEVIKVLDTGPITNHVNFARNSRGQFAYVTVGGLNLVKVFRTEDFEQVARSRLAHCHTGYGRPEMARASMSGSRTLTPLPSSIHWKTK